MHYKFELQVEIILFFPFFFFYKTAINGSYLSVSQKSSRAKMRGKKGKEKNYSRTEFVLLWYRIYPRNNARSFSISTLKTISCFHSPIYLAIMTLPWERPFLIVSYRLNGRSLRMGVLFSVYREYIRAFVFIRRSCDLSRESTPK